MSYLPYDQFPFCGGTYQAISPVIDCERSINLYPEVNPRGAKSQVAMIGTPGLLLYGTLPHSPVRGLWGGNGRLFAVGGTHFYEVDPVTYGVITDYGAMIGSPNFGPCRIVSNAVQLLVMDPGLSHVFNANPAGPSMDFVLNAFDIEFLDDFFFALDAGTVNGIDCSAPADGTTWPGLSRIIKTTTPDQVAALLRVGSTLFVFGQKTTVPFTDVGSAGFPLQAVQGAIIEEGAFNIGASSSGPAAYHVVRIGNTAIWFGSDDRGWGSFYRLSGASAIRISTPGVDNLVASYGGITGASAFAYSEGGHEFYWINFPSANSGAGASLVYDLTTNFWHERAYLNGSTLERARPNCFASVETVSAGPVNFVGDYANGNIYKMSLAYPSDNGATIRRVRTAPAISNQNQWLDFGGFFLDADIGAASPTLTYSNDGGRTFPLGPYTLQVIGTAAAAGVKTLAQLQCGRSRDRVFRLQIDSSTEAIRLINAYADVRP